MTTWYYNRPLQLISQRDTIKHEIVWKIGVTLIHVPCWWDGNAESLQATINFSRPGTFKNIHSEMIPLNPSNEFFNVRKVKQVGELMGASFSASVEGIPNTISPEEPWWLGEKYDGIRCCWNPLNKTLYTRVGNRLNFVGPYITIMPPIFLDCEAWFGRGSFADSAALLHSDTTKSPFLRLITFDKPDISSHRLKFERRYKALLNTVDKLNPIVIVAMRVRCTDPSFLAFILDTLIADGAEGVILRKKGSPYIHGKSDLLWKLKTVRDDAEALVVREEPDSTFMLQRPNGSTFLVSAPKNMNLKKGDVVTFTYENYTRNSVPTNPKILHVRYDLNWGDVVREYLAQLKKGNENAKKPQDHADMRNRKNVRSFFESFAKRKNLDPLLAHTWYSVAQELRGQKEMRSIVTNYGSYIKALQAAFPESRFQESKFSSMPYNYWTDIQNRYKYFCSLAKRNAFDPVDAKGWYSLSLESIIKDKNINSIISYYNYSFSKALLHLFPNIGLDKSVLTSLVSPYTVSNQRMVLQSFAERQGFDPLVAENWYSISKDALYAYSDTRFVEKLYKGNLKTALTTIFPDIGLVAENFDLKEPRVYSKRERRQFFDEFASAANFDPLVPANWYSVSAESILEKKNAYAILRMYKRNLITALVDVYPEIGLDIAKFGYWERPSNRKLFFTKYAQQKRFDPLVPENWYNLKKADIIHLEGAHEVLQYYRGNLALALFQLFPRIGFEREKFGSWKKPGNYWKSAANRAKFFNEIARQIGVDPLLPESWYNLQSSTVYAHKGVASVLQFHNKSVRQALIELYPNIGLQKSKFLFLQ
eukprot:Phypoly_transcript_02352.p1 GENE.Phypoly_transcript_02352~~Phypoly_transcript_02352.p1  ORF type:complete len:819 (+),score=94.09 Phypoly_transcript_02352:352-2808(+)